MISRIIDISVEHKLAVLALAVAGCIAGWWAMVRLPLDATPDLSDTQVIIFSHWDRSPDILIAFKPYSTIGHIDSAGNYIAGHGSPWNYDRRVPILFWRPGVAESWLRNAPTRSGSGAALIACFHGESSLRGLATIIRSRSVQE